MQIVEGTEWHYLGQLISIGGPQMSIVKHIVMKLKRYEAFRHIVLFVSNRTEKADRKTQDPLVCEWKWGGRIMHV